MRPGSKGGWDMAHLDRVGGVPLGILANVVYEQATITLDPGQTLLFYTDGITEALSPEGTMFGIHGIENSLTECTGEPDCAIEHITSTLRHHEENVRPTDDQTLVVMRVM
jgi:sigma-B regulation protein RsbU (phosphoserine phosphatase)